MGREHSIYRRDEALGTESLLFQGFHQDFHTHFHPYYVLGVIDRGRRLVTWDRRQAAAGPGTLLLFRPGQPHACRALGEEPLHYRSLNLPAPLVEKALARLALSPASLPTLVPGFSGISLFSSLHRSLLAAPAREETVTAALVPLLAGLRPFSGEAASTTLPAPQTALIQDYLSRYLTQPVRLEELARLTGQSRYRLIRSFARDTGLTPHSYLLALRVNAAQALLRTGASPLEAALGSGFADQSHLDRHFKRRMGLTPSQYLHHSFSKEATP